MYIKFYALIYEKIIRYEIFRIEIKRFTRTLFFENNISVNLFIALFTD